jgi:Gamma-glutamyl cyclotransferase, AIG2-like
VSDIGGVLGADHPAVMKTNPMHNVHGFLVHPRTLEDLKMLEDFENEFYCRELVEVINSVNHKTPAYVYVWCDDIEDLADSDWSLDEFEAR